MCCKKCAFCFKLKRRSSKKCSAIPVNNKSTVEILCLNANASSCGRATQSPGSTSNIIEFGDAVVDVENGTSSTTQKRSVQRSKRRKARLAKSSVNGLQPGQTIGKMFRRYRIALHLTLQDDD